MNNSENLEDINMCFSCISSGAIYNDETKECEVCLYCGGTGVADDVANERFLSTIIINN